MSTTLKKLTDFAEWNFDVIIDVRSPAEFEEDHIPGAINLPVLSNEERVTVGTIYVQDSTFKAKKIGAAIVARNAANHIENALAEKTGAWRPLVHCWRGGQRSGSFASILKQIGWRAEVLEGGYKAYRRLVVDLLYNQPLEHRFILIDGNTGTAKTEILEHLTEAGAQTLDLEAMAAHRGSLFGATSKGQPAQKMFESRLANALVLLDPSKPTFVEAESNKIGDILIPTSFWQAMIKAPRITIKASMAARTEFLTRSYADLLEDRELLLKRVRSLGDFHSKDQIGDWESAIAEERFQELAHSLIEKHYDPRYAKTYHRRERVELGSVDLTSLDSDTLRNVAVAQILALSQSAG